MTEAVGVKRQTVLDRREYGFLTGVMFGFTADPAPDNWSPGIETVLSVETWDELGRPERITVTVEPGDRLNG